MGARKSLLLENVCYHLITRGNQKQDVFVAEQDFICYLSFLKKFKQKHKVRIMAYCLMPNHVHLLVGIEEPQNLSSFMHDLNRTYTLYFNKKHQKVGHLWQGRFKSKVVTKDNYLFDCLNYIESNAVRADIVERPQDYKWSSYDIRIPGKDDSIIDQVSVD